MEARAGLGLYWSIHEDHLDEAAFLWEQWERSLVSSRYRLHEVVEAEERVLAHLDGLALGNAQVAEQLLVLALESGEPGRIASAAFALMNCEHSIGNEALQECLRTGDAPLISAIQRALQLVEARVLPDWLPRLLGDSSPELQALAVDVLSTHGMIRDVGALQKLLGHEEPRMSAAVLRAMARGNAEVDRALLRHLLGSDDPGVRDAAITAGLIQGRSAAWKACLEVLGEPDARLPRLVVAMGGKEDELNTLRALWDNRALRPDVLWALGFSGRMSSAEACIGYMQEASLTALAAEAFCAITGLQLAGRYLQQSEEKPAEPVPFEQEDLDAHLVPGPEEELPLPNVPAVAEWWHHSRARFAPESRYVAGQVLESQVLFDVLERESMRRRHAWALEVALRSRGAVWISTSTWARRQAAALQPARAQHARRLGRSFTEGLGG